VTSIESVLRNNGPMLSGELAEILLKDGDANKEAIRKRLSRTKLPITRVGGFFADNQSMFYLQEQFNSEIYFDGLLTAFKKGAKRMYAVIKAIEYHHGVIKVEHLPCYTFSPTNNLTGHKKITKVIKELVDLKVILIEDGAYRLNLFLSKKRNSNYNEYKAIETAKNFVLIQFLSWARSIGLTSYNMGSFYSEFAKFQWGFVSPSYINSLTSSLNGKITPAFVCADVLIGKEAKEEDVTFFIEKIKILNAQKRLSKFIPFLIVDSVSANALKSLKSNGIVVGFLNKLFGYEYSDLLKALINTITNAGAILKANPEQYLILIEKLNKLVDGKTNNLRGDLFEMAVGFYHSRLCQSLDIGKQINFEGARKETDVFAVYANEIKVAEFKGYKNKVTKEEIELWLSDKINVIRKWILNQPAYDNKSITFEFWSTGGFEDDALEKIKYATETTKKYNIQFYDQASIIEKVKEVNSKRFNDILRQYYFGEEL
jgi:hypothetical protein